MTAIELTSKTRNTTLAVIATAAFSQHMPLLFLLVIVPTTLREGASLALVASFAFVFLPFALQFLWAPMIERRRAAEFAVGGWLGSWRNWLLLMQVIAAVCVASLSGLPLGEDAFLPLIAIMVTLSIVIGTQKIASGGFAVESLGDGAARAIGTVAIGSGSALGSLFGTIALIAVYAHFGWSLTCMATAALMLAASALYLLPSQADGERRGRIDHPSLENLLRSATFRMHILAVAALGVPLGLSFGLVQPRLSDAGFTVTQIGLVNGLGQFAMWIVIALPTASAIKRFGATVVRRAILVLSACCSFALGGLTMMAGASQMLALVSACAAMAALIGLSMPTYTLFMKQSNDGGQPATDFSVYIGIFGVTIIAAAGLSGLIAGTIGYGQVQVLAGALFSALAITLTARP